MVLCNQFKILVLLLCKSIHLNINMKEKISFFWLFRNIFTGLILDSYGYFMLEIFFIICLEIALLAAAFLYVYNSIKKGMLNDTPAVRRAKQAALEPKINTTADPVANTNDVINKIAESPLSPVEDDERVAHA